MLLDFEVGPSIVKLLIDEVVCQRVDTKRLIEKINVQCSNLGHLQLKTVFDFKNPESLK